MILEVTLVKTQTQYLPVGTFLERKRYQIDSEVDAMSAIVKFIGDNIDIMSSMIIDKVFVEKLSTLKSLPADAFACVRSILAQSNIDIWAWVVSETETNASEPTEDSIEYNIVDTNMAMTESMRFCSKIIMPSEALSYTNLYTKIKDTFGLFDETAHPIFTGMSNPYDNLLSAISAVERPTGAVTSSFVSQLADLCKYLGKNIYVVMNQ